MRLTIVVSNVRGGGSTFAAVCWANAWAERGKVVSVIAMLPAEGEGPEFPRHPAITLVRIDLTETPVSGKLGAAAQIINNLAQLRRAIRATAPDLVLSFDGPVNTRTLMACLGLSVPVVVMEQVHPAYYKFGRFWERMRRCMYPRAAAVVNLTRAATDWCRTQFGLKHTFTIPNPVLPPAVRRTPGRAGSRLVIAAGRLVDQKRFDLLIQAFALATVERPAWSLAIYGEGPNRGDLECQAAAAGLSDRVRLPGWASPLAERLAEGEFFVLSSEYEGFGNVIVEALAVGLPVVAFNCPSGPSDIIRHEVDGLLVPPLDTCSLASAMSRLMADAELRTRLSARAPEALERFSMAHTLGLWDTLLATIHPAWPLPSGAEGRR